MTLPPDPDFAIHVVLRVHCQRNYTFIAISPVCFQDHGWFFYCKSDFTRQVWY